MILAILGWIVFGLVIGALARLLVPGRQPMGLVATMLLGVAGSFVGGLVAYLLVGGSPVQASGWVGSLLGAVAVVLITQATAGRRISS